MAGRRRSPPVMPENSYYGFDKPSTASSRNRQSSPPVPDRRRRRQASPNEEVEEETKYGSASRSAHRGSSRRRLPISPGSPEAYHPHRDRISRPSDHRGGGPDDSDRRRYEGDRSKYRTDSPYREDIVPREESNRRRVPSHSSRFGRLENRQFRHVDETYEADGRYDAPQNRGLKYSAQPGEVNKSNRGPEKHGRQKVGANGTLIYRE